MPELAEVEFYRRIWNAGIGKKVIRVHVHTGKRIFRGIDMDSMIASLTGSALRGSAAHGKQMLFSFSKNAWLGLHLGMTGELRVEPKGHTPAKHDHLVLFQRDQSLVFSDPRLFGRVLFSVGNDAPEWWRNLPPAISDPKFTSNLLKTRLGRHRALPIKAALLDQASFPGVGNWMADEILWQARLHPQSSAGSLTDAENKTLWRVTRQVARRAIETIAAESDQKEFGDPPKGYLFHVRWRKGGRCPRDGSPLSYATVGGRTTVWCASCQRKG